jgi:flagellar M-ring protein FliF
MQKMSLLGLVLIGLAAIIFLVLQARVADYQLLYADLDPAEASSIVDWLQEHDLPYQLQDQGRAVYIPAAEVYATRLKLAGAGLPKGQGVGFEIFDEQRFGVTRFTQRVNYQRALQGELARSVSSLNAVKAARIHLALPEREFLRQRQKKAKASVVIELEPGQALGESQILGITHLVSGSIEGLEQGQVTVVDAQGRVLSDGQPGDQGPSLSPKKLEYKQAIEKRYEQQGQALLDRVFGPNKAMVRVTAQVDFVQRHTTQELYDPDSIVPRSEKTTERSPSGGTEGQAEAQASGQSSSTETINYEISRTVNEISKDRGEIKRLSVAVLVGQQSLEAQGEQGEAKGDVQSIDRLISTALGLNKQRGDSIEVVAMPTHAQPLAKAQAGSSISVYQFMPLIKYALLALALVLVYLLLIRPMLRNVRGGLTPQYKTVEQLETELGQEAPNDPTRQLKQEMSQSKVTPAQIVKAWLKDN